MFSVHLPIMDVSNSQLEPVQPDPDGVIINENSLSQADDIAVPQVLSAEGKQEDELLSAITHELQLPDISVESYTGSVVHQGQDAANAEQVDVGPTGAAAVVAALNESEDDQNLVAALLIEQAEADPGVDVLPSPAKDVAPINSKSHISSSNSYDQASTSIIEEQEAAILAADEQIHLDTVDTVQEFIPNNTKEDSDNAPTSAATEKDTAVKIDVVTAGLAPEAEIDAESVLTSPLGSSVGLSAQESSSLSNTSSGSAVPTISSLPSLPNLSTLDEEGASQHTDSQGKPFSSRSAASATRPQRQRATSGRSSSSAGTNNPAAATQLDTSAEASSSRSTHAPPKRTAAARSRRPAAPASPASASLPSPVSVAAAGTSRTRSLALAKEQKEKEAEAKAARVKSRLARGKRAETTSESEDDDEDKQEDGSPELIDTSLTNSDIKGKIVKAEEVDNAHKALAAAARPITADIRRPSAHIEVDEAEQSGMQRRRSSRNTANTSVSSKGTSTSFNSNGKRSAPQTMDDSTALDEDDPDDGVTRCVCGRSDEDSAGFMIMCETCKAWQHGPCMGFKLESQCPETYYCELCRPDLHPTLTRGKRHARTGSSSSIRPSIMMDVPPPSPSTNPILSKSVSDSAPKEAAPTLHRARSSADASIVASLLETKKSSHSPSPGSPGPLSADGKRPMYPATSHLSAPAQPKRRSTMNSRESAAFDESILLANANAIKESMMMAASAGSPNLMHHGSSSFVNGNRKRKAGSSHLGDDDASGDVTMDTVKEEEEDESSTEPLETALDTQDPPDRIGDAIARDEDYRQPRAKKRNKQIGGRQVNGRAIGNDSVVAEEEESPAPIDSGSQKRKRKAGYDGALDGSEAINNSVHPDDQMPKRRKASPGDHDRNVDIGPERNAPILHVNSIALTRVDERSEAVRANDSSGNAPDAPSHAAGAEPATNCTGPDLENLSAPTVIYAKKGKGPSSSDDDSSTTAAVSVVTGRGRIGQWRGRGGRGGKISPSKRAALAAAHAAADASRRGFGRDETPLNDDFSAPMTWGVPDHLSHLSHLLPTPAPQPLQVPVYTAPSKPSANHRGSRRPSPGDLTAVSPLEEASPESSELQGAFPQHPPFQQPTSHSYEAPSKIKFPSRRMSVSEMRKRAKTVLDYIGRMQVEMVDRNHRNRVLGVMQERLLLASSSSTPGSTPGAIDHAVSLPPTPNPAVTTLKTGSISAVASPVLAQAGAPHEAASMLSDLSRQLINFQDKFC